MDEADVTELNWDAVKDAVRQFAVVSGQERILSQRKKELRDRLEALVQVEGVEDDKGHLRLQLPEPIEGLAALTVQRRKTAVFDADKAEEILKAITTEGDRTLWDDCIELVPMLDEDKVMAARYQGLLTDEQIDEMYPWKVTEAFTPVKAS